MAGALEKPEPGNQSRMPLAKSWDGSARTVISVWLLAEIA